MKHVMVAIAHNAEKETHVILLVTALSNKSKMLRHGKLVQQGLCSKLQHTVDYLEYDIHRD